MDQSNRIVVPEPAIGWRKRAGQVSLPEVHRSIVVPTTASFWRKMLAFAGPGYLVAVGYMDPGNWATDLAGGAQFGYSLLAVIMISNFMAILLQYLCIKLGVVTGRDLAQACRDHYSTPVVWFLWIICEMAIAACDLAEVVGSAIGLQLLFKIPLVWGCLITASDVMLVLYLQTKGFRYIEAIVITLIAIIGSCFAAELIFSKPSLTGILSGLVPGPHIVANQGMLYVSIGILGATVMPHNLYLHSSIVQTRKFEQSVMGRRQAIKFATIDSTFALMFALFISAASMLFAVALLASGQNSTLTGTLAGQIVMEGFLNLRLKPWLRRLITRLIAIVPAVLVIGMFGEGKTTELLVASQVALSMQLGFAVWPLVRFTGEHAKMGEFANRLWLKILGWTTAAIIILLNLKLLLDTFLPDAALKSLYDFFHIPVPTH